MGQNSDMQGIKLQLAMYKDALISSIPSPHLIEQSEEIIDRAIAYKQDLEEAITDTRKALSAAKDQLKESHENSIITR